MPRMCRCRASRPEPRLVLASRIPTTRRSKDGPLRENEKPPAARWDELGGLGELLPPGLGPSPRPKASSEGDGNHLISGPSALTAR